MGTFTYIIIYISICALMIVFIQSVRSQWRDFIMKSIPQGFKDKKLEIKIILSPLLIVVIILFFILTPLLLPILMRYDRENRKREKEEIIDDNLYFWRMGGVGEIQCLDCNYQERIISFIHGLNSSTTGLQCQSCGKFHALDNWDERKQIQCDCQGELERNKPLFCPKCRSKNMKYDMIYIT